MLDIWPCVRVRVRVRVRDRVKVRVRVNPARASALSPLSSCTGSYAPGPGTFASCRSDLDGMG